ncbi:MAG: hypothetical protein IJY54_02110 [Paludibacteraceae bacterium]|nr:hypothetical protein [Paludibacteraceae bacterium]
MRYFKAPYGEVKFKIGSKEYLPVEAEEIKLFMVSGDPAIYIVPISEMGNDLDIKIEEEGIYDSHLIF